MLENRRPVHQQVRSHSDRRAGFTLIELLIVVVVIGVIAVAVVPAYVEMMWRSKVELAARQATIQMRAARFQAIQEARPYGVWADFANNRIVLFRGTDPPPPEGSGTEVRAFELPGGIVFQGPEDGVRNGNAAVLIYPPDPASDHENANGGWFVFDPNGASDAGGEIRFAMAQRNLYYRTAVDPKTTGTVSVCKYSFDDSTWLC